MKGAFGLLVTAAVIWIFWMTWEWGRKRRDNRKNEK